MIPRTLHQVWMGPAPVPVEVESWPAKNPTLTHRLWRDQECEAIVRAKGLGPLWDALAGTKDVWNGRCDLARWCILHEHGGVYVDADMLCIKELGNQFFDATEFWAVYESETRKPGLVTSAAMGAVPRSPVIYRAVSELARQTAIVEDAWKQLGPGLLTRILADVPGATVFPSSTFNPGHFTDSRHAIGPDTVALHNWGTTRERKGARMTLPDATAPTTPVTIIVPLFPPRSADNAAVLVASHRAHASNIPMIFAVPERCHAFDRLGPEIVRANCEGIPFPKCRLMNAGAQAAASKYLVFHDADLPFPPHFGQVIEHAALEGKVRACGLVRALAKTTTRQAADVRRDPVGMRFGYAFCNGERFEQVRLGNRHPGGSSMIERATFEKAGKWNEQFIEWGCEDFEFGARLTGLLGDGWWASGPALYFVHLWHEQAAHEGFAKQRRMWKDAARAGPPVVVRESPGTPVDLVYLHGSGSIEGDVEIRYSVRSMMKHCANRGRLVIVGTEPGEMSGFHFIPMDDPHKHNREANMIRKVLAACDDPGVSDPFLLISDDHYALRDFDPHTFGPCFKGDMAAKQKSDLYALRVRRTACVCQELGLPTLNYDCHIPMLIHKALYREAMARVKWDVDGSGVAGVLCKSVYGNSLPERGRAVFDGRELIQNKLFSSTGAVIACLQGREFLSTPPKIPRPVLRFLSQRFPERSTYEETDLPPVPEPVTAGAARTVVPARVLRREARAPVRA